jgi:hypothetical protein
MTAISRSALFSVALLSLLAANGCSAPPRTVDWRTEALALSRFPAPYDRLALGEVTVHEISPVSTLAAALPGEQIPIDAGLVRAGVHDALVGLGLFHEVTDGFTQATPSGNGMIVDLSFDDAALLHTGENDEASKAFWLWLFTGYPGLCVRDQLYGLRYEASVQVRDGATGEILVPWEPLGGPDTEPLALNFHERTSGVGSYLKTNIMPPSSIAIDPHEVLAQILGDSLRPQIQSLVRIFGQISFFPASRIDTKPSGCPGVRVDDVKTQQRGEGLVSVTLALTVDEGVHALREVRVNGDKWIDFTRGPPPPVGETHVELPLGTIAVPPGGSIAIAVVLEGSPDPEPIVTIASTPSGELRAERRR